MTPINEVPVGKFVRFGGNVCYICNNNFSDNYGVIPIEGSVPRDKDFKHKVYIYKRIKKEWVKSAKEIVKFSYSNGNTHIDNLTYIENLAILKSYGI